MKVEIKERHLKSLNLHVSDVFIIECIKNDNIDLLKVALQHDPVVKIRLDILINRDMVYYIDGKYSLPDKTVKDMYTLGGLKRKKDIESLVMKYRDLFPKGSNNNGYPYKGDKQGCIKKMTRFVKLNPEFSEDVILKATQKYINDKRRDNYHYMHLAHYFIEKNNVSALGALCEQIVNGEEDSDFKNILEL